MGAKGRVVVAMSGGVDSSVAAALLKEEGWEVLGVTLRLWEDTAGGGEQSPERGKFAKAIQDARGVARSLAIPHYVVDRREPFRETVVDYFAREYARGCTPNPCVLCNRKIKFAALLEKARELGADYIATGHYARVEFSPERGRYLLKKGVSREKDQSYMLYNLSQEQLARCLFPLGGMTKTQVRRKAEMLGLAVAGKKESQEICFIADGDYRSFLGRCGIRGRPGPILHVSGRRLGTHRGIPFYTVGQRRGLGITWPHPLYVLEIRPQENLIVVGEREALYRRGARVRRLNLISISALEGRERVKAKIRYRAPEVEALLKPAESGEGGEVCFAEPQPAVTPGQAAVFYQEDLVLGGGTIVQAF